jgi:hypothetical protein
VGRGSGYRCGIRQGEEEVCGTANRDVEDAGSRVGEFLSRHLTGRGCIRTRGDQILFSGYDEFLRDV